ncbi:MAG: DUF4296 domain-containing protein [Bacteroidota bacterium]
MKVLRLAFCLFLLVSLTNCEKEPTSDLLSDEQIVPILADIHVAEAAMQNLVGITKDSMGNIYYRQIFELHDIDSAIYNKTMDLLRKDPIRLSKVYNEVVIYLEEKERSLK